VSPNLAERAIVLAPHGRDAAIAVSMLTEAGMQAEICNSLPMLLQALDAGVGFALITEEGLRGANPTDLSDWLKMQPEWSDLPFILLTQKGGGLERNPAARRFLDLLGNVTFLERPFHPTTLVSLAEAALRGRRRQYDARARLEDLSRAANKYRSLFESIDAGFCIVEMIFDSSGQPIDYVFVEANPAFERLTGLCDAQGRSIRALLPAHDDRLFETFGEVARSGTSIRFEQRAHAAGDTWYDVYAFPAGLPVQRRVAILFTDISPRRRMEQSLRENEERLRKLNETLEERVAERTEALEHSQNALRQSQKLESIGQLTGGVAHDFNNLLMAIMSSLTLLEKRLPPDPALHRLIDNARQGTERGAALTQRMLAFARRQDLYSTRVDVADLVRDMTDLLERTIGPQWHIDVRIPDALPAVVADANQVEMALLNLAVNARDAMSDGGEIVIAAEERILAEREIHGLKAGAYVGLSVVDSGMGMSAETLERATEPFFTTKGVGKGTGLGLPMVHGLAKQLGGTFALKSTLGQGTSATLWLPAARASAEQPEAAQREEDRTASLRPLKIVAVDDDSLILMNTSALLEDLGHRVLEASSGSDAIALIEEHPDIDLMITDQAMPHMTGAQLVQQVNRLRPDLPIILATGYGEVPPGFESTVVKLSKPFSQRVLAEALNLAIGRRRD
jgi:signal transduction histidine kinase